MSWPRVSLKNESSVITKGTTPTSLGHAFTESGVPFIRAQNLVDGSVSVSADPLFISPATNDALKRSKIKADDVLISIAGTIGRAAIVPSDAQEMNCNQAVAIVRPSENIDRRFLLHWLSSNDALSQMARGKVTGVISNLSLGEIGKLEIPLPPLEEQKRIAGILDQADALRRLRTRALEKLNTLGQAIFHEMFGDVNTNPRDWPMGCIGDLLDGAKYGSSAKANTEGRGLAMLRMGNVTYDGLIDLTSLKHVELSDVEFPKYTTRKGDLLFNRTNSKELVGKTAVVKQEEPLAFAGYLVRGRANHLGNTDYISAYLNSAHGKATLVGMCKNIVGMANINAKELQTIRIAMPPKELQDDYSKAIEALAPKREKLLQAIRAQVALFASLQHRAFRGEL